MRFVILTQDERLFLPLSIEILVERKRADIACIIMAPALSTFRNSLRGLWRNLVLFGIRGSLIMAWRLAWTGAGPLLGLRPRDRKYWSLAELGRRTGIPTYSVERINSRQTHRLLDDHPADLLVSMSCPQIIRRKLLRRFALGGINVHSAPLPRYRGLLPSFWTLYHGERQTAVTVHVLAKKLDSGDILLQRPVDIAPGETWISLVRKTKTAAGEALVEAIERWQQGTLECRQNPEEGSSYFSFPTWRDVRDFRARGLRML